LDNMCTVHHLRHKSTLEKFSYREQMLHRGYVSCIRWMGSNDEVIITASGDYTCIMWDLESDVNLATFEGHGADVMSVSTRENIFVTGSCDGTARVWDVRLPPLTACTQIFQGHGSDVNTVQFFPDTENTFAIGTGSDDGFSRLFDMRSAQLLSRYSLQFENKMPVCSVTTVDFSLSGQYLFSATDDHCVYAWNTLTAKLEQTLSNHNSRVSCLGVSKDGKALATGSWDTFLQVWA